jgi:hypothetical protein
MTKKPLTRGRIQRLLKNPGTRAALADKFLPPDLLAQRNLNRRLNAPITPGSAVTERDLSRQTRTASDVRYGQAEQQSRQDIAASEQRARNVAAWYDNYLKELASHQQNVAGFQSQATQAVQGLSQAGAGLGSGAAENLSADNQQTAANASAVRRALVDSYGAMLSSQGANANTYASSLAHVVGPGQKLQAQQQAQGRTGKAQQALEQLLREKGAFRQQLGDERRQDEAKSVLATSIATGKEVANTPTAKAAVAGATEEARQAAKYGYSLHDWRTLGPKGRATVRGNEKGSSGDTVYSSGPFAGRTKADVQALSDTERKRLVDAYRGGGKGKQATSGAGSASPAAQTKAVSQIRQAQRYVSDLRAKGVADAVIRNGLNQGYITDSKGNRLTLTRINPDFVNAAFDLEGGKYGKGLSPANVNVLHRRYGLRLRGVFPIASTSPRIVIPGFGVNTPLPTVK